MAGRRGRQPRKKGALARIVAHRATLPLALFLLAASTMVLIGVVWTHSSAKQDSASNEVQTATGTIQDSIAPEAKSGQDVASHRVVSIGIVPSQLLEQPREESEKLAEHLSRLSGLTIKLVLVAQEGEVADGIHAGDLDAGFLSGSIFVNSEVSRKAKWVLRATRSGSGDDCLRSAIVIRPGNEPPTNLADLCDSTIGYTEVDSSSGFLFGKLAILQEASKRKIRLCNLADEQFLGDEKAVLDALTVGEIDAGVISYYPVRDSCGTSSSIEPDRKWGISSLYELQVVHLSQAMPFGGFVVSSRVDSERTETLKKLLLDSGASPNLREMFRQVLSISGFVESSGVELEEFRQATTELQELVEKYAKAGSAE